MNGHGEKKAGQSIAVGRVGEVLDAIAAVPRGITASELAIEVGISRSAALRLLDSMAAAGIARRNEDTKRYFLGLRLHHWGSKAAMTYLPSALIRHELILLAEAARHPAFYAVLDEDSVIVIERTEEVGGNTVVVPYTTHYHWPASTTGLALVAFSPPEVRQHLLDLERGQPDPEPVWHGESVETVLDQVSRQGYAERTLNTDRSTLAAPLLDYSGYAVAALGLAVSGYNEAEKARLPIILKAAAAKCSGFLGHVTPLSVL